MEIDDTALSEYINDLKKNFKSIENIFSQIQESLDLIYSRISWSGLSRDYFFDVCKKLLDDFKIIQEKFLNISQYVDSVLDNFHEFNSQLLSIGYEV